MLDVLYIVAHSRSGSTLLARMLGQLEHVASVGELRYLWQRGMVEDQLCGCGESFRTCPFWSSVTSQAYGAWERSVGAAMAARVRAADRIWRMPLKTAGKGCTAESPLVRAALDAVEPLYSALRQCTGARVVVDSSKSPSYARLLSLSPELNVQVLHLVRDSRGVAFSRLRRVARGELRSRSRGALLARTGLEWAIVNRLAEQLGRTLPYLLVRYEDFVADPGRTLAAIVDALGLPPGPMPFLERGGVRLPGDHTVAGNQMRFESGWLALRPDEEWRSQLTRWDTLILQAFGRGGLSRYGYV